MTNENDVTEAEQLLRKIGAALDHPSLYMGGPSRQSMMKAAALLPIIERTRTQAVEAATAGHNKLIERLLARVANGGPHEWGYRDLTTGEFIADDWPFEVADALSAAVHPGAKDKA